MEFLEKIGEFFGLLFGGLARGVERLATSIFGSGNARYLKKAQPRVDAINELEPKFVAMSDDELRQQTDQFRERLKQGETLDDLLVEAFALCREAGRRWLNMRHYDVQLVGGMVLHEGKVAEMITGEGKTLVATLPVYLNALEGKGVHVVSVNSYLARRDMEWMGPLYLGLGLTVGAIYPDMDPEERQRAYACEITYGTNNEFGFDYLRDNMKDAIHGDERFDPWRQQVQRGFHYAVIDEVDNILIDEARTPLIISGPAHDDISKYSRADKVVRQLKPEVHFEVKEKEHSCHLTEAGVREAERLAGVESFYTAGNMEWPHLLDNALKAHHLYKRDVRYLIEDGEIIIVDEFTGRKMPGRQWSDGLHQAVEAKEGVTIKEENQTLATVTLQNFFKLYKKLAGMTGTAMTEATEFDKIYHLDVISIPTNKEMQRVNHADVIYLSEDYKYQAIAGEIERISKWDVIQLVDGNELLGVIKQENDEQVKVEVKAAKKTMRTLDRGEIKSIERRGRPILVGTVSIEKSERVSASLNRRGIPHEILNAKNHKREADIVAQAGRMGAVTIATNMAGRGTDIVLGGNPETMAWAQLQDKYASRLDVPRPEWDTLVTEIEQREGMKEEGRQVAARGGLHVIGTERHEARRIDNQLRGRCGRQGDPGSSRFYLSLEDDLMRIFAKDWVRAFLQRMGMTGEDAIESRIVSRRIEGAQKKVEERNFETRKNLLEYDEVMDEQRKRVYGYRQRILEGVNCKQLIVDMIDEQIEQYLDDFLDPDYGPASFCKWIGGRLNVEDLQPHAFRDMDFQSAEEYAKDEAERAAEAQVHEEIEQHLPGDVEDTSEWNWGALARAANTRWELSVNERELKKVARDDIAEFLIEKAQQAVHKVDCSEGAKFLEPDFGLHSARGWVHYKFGIELDIEQIREMEPADVKEFVRQQARKCYGDKETEYPVMAGLYHFTVRESGGQRRYDRQALVQWAAERFGVEMTVDDLRNKQREEVHSLLIERSRQNQRRAAEALEEANAQVDKVLKFGGMSAASRNGQLGSFTHWLKDELQWEVSAEELAEMDDDELKNRVITAVEDHYRPEIRRMERQLLLQLLDSAWKDHLLAMDHLRYAVGLMGYAQKDPKVEYKREGMALYKRMWQSIGEQTTDLVFRMEQLDEDFVGSTWTVSEARHDEAMSAAEMAQQAAMNAGGEDVKMEPIRNTAPRVRRNDPCPCGSGKKFKQCCGKAGVAAPGAGRGNRLSR